jgi:hypothetical protein
MAAWGNLTDNDTLTRPAVLYACGRYREVVGHRLKWYGERDDLATLTCSSQHLRTCTCVTHCCEGYDSSRTCVNPILA